MDKEPLLWLSLELDEPWNCSLVSLCFNLKVLALDVAYLAAVCFRNDDVEAFVENTKSS